MARRVKSNFAVFFLGVFVLGAASVVAAQYLYGRYAKPVEIRAEPKTLPSEEARGREDKLAARKKIDQLMLTLAKDKTGR
ncbi:MAG TPA: hypothetical protein VKT73_05045 [Xanthobacteraceae bacterium]|nr:hypothetical protein [Xanthobacteraceae bacterium]